METNESIANQETPSRSDLDGSNRFLPIILIVLALGLGAWLGLRYLPGRGGALPNEVPPAETSTTEAPTIETPANTEPTEPTAFIYGSGEMESWQAYRNEEYGFEFKYPPVFSVSDEKILNNPSQSFSLRLRGNNQIDLSLIVLPGDQKEEIERWSDSVVGENGVDKIYLTAQGLKIIKRYDSEIPTLAYDILDVTQGRVAEFFDADSSLQWFVDDILSTFKFFEPIAPQSDSKYKQVELKDVIKYADIAVNNYVETNGMVAGVQVSPNSLYGYSLLLKDSENNYLLVPLGKFGAIEWGEFYGDLKIGDKIEVSGIAGFTAPADSNLEKRFNISTTNFPRTIGMISDPDDIKIIN